MADPIRYVDLTAPERAALDAWQKVSADTTGMLYAVRHALAAAGPAIAEDARQRLARHLFLAERGDEWAAREWDLPQHVNQEPYLRRADVLLAVITGKEN